MARTGRYSRTPRRSRQRAQGLAQGSASPLSAEQRVDLARRLPRIERQHHRLDRPDRGRRHRQAAIAERDQRHRLQRAAADLAAQRDRLAVTPRRPSAIAFNARRNPADKVSNRLERACCRDRRRRDIAEDRWSRPTGNRRGPRFRRAATAAKALRPSRRLAVPRARAPATIGETSSRSSKRPHGDRIRRRSTPSAA